MPVFTIQAPDGRKIKIEAADQETALRGAQEWAAQNPAQKPTGPTIKVGAREMSVDEYRSLPEKERQALRDQIVDANPTAPGMARPDPLGTFVQGTTFGFGDEIRGAVQGGISALQGGDYGQTYRQTVGEARTGIDTARRRNPLQSLGLEVAGAIPTGMLAGGQLLGRGASLGTRALTGAGVGAAQGAVYGAGAAEGSLADRAGASLVSGGIGGALGGAIPLAGAAIRSGAGAIADRVRPIVGGARNPAEEGARRVGMAVQRDMAANPQMMINQADEAAASQYGVPLINADRGGETTRALVRSVANQSPEARAVIERTASDRFSGQANRAVDFMKRVVGGNVDDLRYRDFIRQAADAANDPAYRKAYSDPAAQRVWNRDLQELLQSDAIQEAISKVSTRSSNRAAVAGQKPIRNPFRLGSDGRWRVVRKANGDFIVPNLAFWDQVKRNLGGMIEGAKRGSTPDTELAMDLMALKGKLVGTLDSLVPDYAAARQGAHSFFQAEDALDAGRKFANATRSLPEAKRAIAAMKPAELKAFQVGYASELVDKIKDARFRANVIDQAFGSPAKRELFEATFGPQQAKQLEAYVRVEDLADKLRGALGNSTTARQLVELGIGAGGGLAVSGGDWRGAVGGAALVRGGRYLGQRIDAKVMQEAAKLLMSGDQAALNRAVANAATSPKWMAAIRALGDAVGASARGASVVGAAQASP